MSTVREQEEEKDRRLRGKESTGQALGVEQLKEGMVASVKGCM